MNITLGWRADKEDQNYLRQRTYKIVKRVFAPEEFDPRPHLQVEDQGQQGSCSGHAVTTATEEVDLLANGSKVQLSRQFSYIMGQKIDGLIGQDQGATITGVVRGAKEYGVCLESTMPYTGQYTTRIPKEATEEAARHKILSHVSLSSHEECLNHLQARGPIVIGIPWTEGLANNRSGVIDINNAGGRNLGGHAIVLGGWDSRGYLWLGNSHGKQWGNGGWALCSPRWIDQQCRLDWSEFIGVSELSESFNKARKWDWIKNNPFV